MRGAILRAISRSDAFVLSCYLNALISGSHVALISGSYALMSSGFRASRAWTSQDPLNYIFAAVRSGGMRRALEENRKIFARSEDEELEIATIDRTSGRGIMRHSKSNPVSGKIASREPARAIRSAF